MYCEIYFGFSGVKKKSQKLFMYIKSYTLNYRVKGICGGSSVEKQENLHSDAFFVLCGVSEDRLHLKLWQHHRHC